VFKFACFIVAMKISISHMKMFSSCNVHLKNDAKSSLAKHLLHDTVAVCGTENTGQCEMRECCKVTS